MTTNRGEGLSKLTAKGAATRARIVEQAAELIYAHGVHGTNNEQLRQVAGISGSQLSHYFPDKRSLVLAVIAWRGEQILGLHTDGRFAGLDSVGALRDWARYYISYERAYQDGCSLGSLANEIVKAEFDVHDQLAGQFDRWTEIFRVGLGRMRERRELCADAEPAQLAHLLLAALQGGILLAQIARDATPLEDALTAAVDHVESCTTVG